LRFPLSFFRPFRVARRCKPVSAFSIGYRALQFTPYNTDATPQVAFCSQTESAHMAKRSEKNLARGRRRRRQPGSVDVHPEGVSASAQAGNITTDTPLPLRAETNPANWSQPFSQPLARPAQFDPSPASPPFPPVDRAADVRASIQNSEPTDGVTIAGAEGCGARGCAAGASCTQRRGDWP
jgi:hypothetical protein